MKQQLQYLLLVLYFVLTANQALASQTPAGEVGELIGSVAVQRKDATNWIQLRFGDPLLVGDTIQTQANGKVKIIFTDQSVITIGPNTKFRIDASIFRTAPVAERSSLFTLFSGKARAIVSSWFNNLSQNKFEVQTPSAVAGVRGTEFVVLVDANGNSEIVVLEGVVEVYNRKDKSRRAVFLGAGMGTRVGTSTTPSTPKQLSSEQLQKIAMQTDIDSNESLDSLDSFFSDGVENDDDTDGRQSIQDNNDSDGGDESSLLDGNRSNGMNTDDKINRNNINQDIQRNTNVRISVDFK